MDVEVATFTTLVNCMGVAYDRGQLLALYTSSRPDASVVDCLHSAGLSITCRMYYTDHLRRRRRIRCVQSLDQVERYQVHIGYYRGCRSSRFCRPLPVLRSVSNGAVFIVGNRPTLRVNATLHRPPPSLLPTRVDRHSKPPGKQLICGCLNVRSLANKVDDLLDVRRNLSVDVLFLTETWHDDDSVCLRGYASTAFKSTTVRGRVCVLIRWRQTTAASSLRRFRACGC